MAYPDHLLAADEEVVKRIHPHWITLVSPIASFIVLAGLGTYLFTLIPADGWARSPLQIALTVVIVIMLLWAVLIPVLRWKTTHYVITSHRVLIRTGILNHNGRDIPLKRINDVAFEQSIFDRIVGAGSLTVESAGEHGQETLSNIPHSDDVQQLLNRLIEADSDRRARDAFGGHHQSHWQDPEYPSNSAR